MPDLSDEQMAAGLLRLGKTLADLRTLVGTEHEDRARATDAFFRQAAARLSSLTPPAMTDEVAAKRVDELFAKCLHGDPYGGPCRPCTLAAFQAATSLTPPKEVVEAAERILSDLNMSYLKLTGFARKVADAYLALWFKETASHG